MGAKNTQGKFSTCAKISVRFRPSSQPCFGARVSRTFAYCRASTADQTTANQVLEIQSAGFLIDARRIVEEHVSGSVPAADRPGFAKFLDRVEPDDVLVVTKLDRLGRNAVDVRNTIERLLAIGIRGHCLALGGVDLTSPAGRMTMQVLCAVAEFERDLLVERTRAGLARARAEGKAIGRPSALTIARQESVRRRCNRGKPFTPWPKSLRLRGDRLCGFEIDRLSSVVFQHSAAREPLLLQPVATEPATLRAVPHTQTQDDLSKRTN